MMPRNSYGNTVLGWLLSVGWGAMQRNRFVQYRGLLLELN